MIMFKSGKFPGKGTVALLVRALGGIQLAIGLFFLVIAPMEVYSFYLFSEGDRFYYDGFGFGSFIYSPDHQDKKFFYQEIKCNNF